MTPLTTFGVLKLIMQLLSKQSEAVIEIKLTLASSKALLAVGLKKMNK